MGIVKSNTKVEILTKTIPLFAGAGYAGVSMRQIAQVVGIKAASLYHHFPDKETLYIETLAMAFSRHADYLLEPFSMQFASEERLQRLIDRLCIVVHGDQNFAQLVEREIMDGNEKRLQLLAVQVFGELFQKMTELCRTLKTDRDPHLMTVSILALVVYHFQTTPIRSFLPGFQDSHNDPKVISHHVYSVLVDGLVTKDAGSGITVMAESCSPQ